MDYKNYLINQQIRIKKHHNFLIAFVNIHYYVIQFQVEGRAFPLTSFVLDDVIIGKRIIGFHRIKVDNYMKIVIILKIKFYIIYKIMAEHNIAFTRYLGMKRNNAISRPIIMALSRSSHTRRRISSTPSKSRVGSI